MSPQEPVAKIVIRSHRDLVVWQRARKLTGACYRLARLLPSGEQYDLQRQIQRAAISVAANIAEGHGRLSRNDYARHISIARGSLMELECLLELCVEVAYFDEAQIAEPMHAADEVGRMLWALARSLGSAQLPIRMRAPQSRSPDALMHEGDA
ncbi:hypothetical protein BAC2_00465 [uncultured bacterium]|nr:hypothetical protein BAC2_00465 [uncultured bacterium]